MIHVKALQEGLDGLQAGHSSQGTSEPITPVTIPAWTKGQLLVGMYRRPDILLLDYDWYSHNSDFRIWSLRLRWSAYNMFSFQGGCLGISVMDLCLANLHVWPWGLSFGTPSPPPPPQFFSGRLWPTYCLTWWRYCSPEGHPLSLFPRRIAYISSTLIGRPSWQQITSMMLSTPYEHPYPQYLSLYRGMHRSMGVLNRVPLRIFVRPLK